MPSPRYIEAPQQSNPLGQILGGFLTKKNEQAQEKQDADFFTKIYGDIEKEGGSIRSGIQALQTTPGISPTRRLEGLKTLEGMESQNNKLAIEASKAAAKAAKDQLKAKAEEREDQVEIDFLKSIEGQDIPSTKLYSKARQAGLGRVASHQISTLGRMEAREDRLSEKQIQDDYKFELQDLTRKAKDEPNRTKREAIDAQIADVRKHMADDIKRHRAGEKVEQISLVAKEAEQEAKAEQEEVIKAEDQEAIDKLTAKMPPTSTPVDTKQRSKKTGREYKNDGKKWVLIN